jgi:hypothetical protein
MKPSRSGRDHAESAWFSPLFVSLSLALAAALAGCSSAPRLDHAARLMRRADFPAAATAATEWCRDALKTINALEYELERRCPPRDLQPKA